VIPRPPVLADGGSMVRGVPRGPTASAPEARSIEPSPVRSVPRPPHANREADANPSARPAMPQTSDGAVSRRTLPAVREVPSPPATLGNDSYPRTGPDEHTPRIVPGVAQRPQNENAVPRPSGPVAPAPPMSNEQRAPRAEPGSYPRSMGGAGAPVPRSAPEPPRASAPVRSVPQQAPAVRESAPSRAPAVSPGGPPHSIKWR